MIRRTRDPSAAARDLFDAIIDVRSPAEYAEDHVPGALNLPVLDDAERAEIGTLYVQTSKFLARRLGAAKVARNIARHLEEGLANREAGFRPLVYCWRGGQRSGAMATVMQQVGWNVTVLDGGYRTWRRGVVARLYDGLPEMLPPVILLEGRTGCGKTDVLRRLAAFGMQTIDLEGLAEHRGSLFGATDRRQPSQKAFETRLAQAMEALDPGQPLFLEAESSRIGDVTLPPTLWAAMRRASRIVLTASIEARTAYVLSVYGDIAEDRRALDDALSRLPRQYGRETLARWQGFAATGELAPLVAELMQGHYDPSYERSTGRREQGAFAELEVDLTPDGFAVAARRIAALIG